MKNISKIGIEKKPRPIRVLQFGEGNFLRGFADYMIDILNEKTDFNGDIVIVKPIEFGELKHFTDQDSIYTVLLRGQENGFVKTEKRIVTCCRKAICCYDDYAEYSGLAKLDSLRFIISNTTEAGIVYNSSENIFACPPVSYPGKLLKFLYERYTYFNGAEDKGLIILPVELIDDNGIELVRIVKRLSSEWELGEEFIKWLDNSCVFASTLVDRIVTGYPKGEDEIIFDEFGYNDKLLVAGEPFALWVIETERDIRNELPFDTAGLPVVFTENQKPYKQRKVRILNGAHTSFMPVSFLSGNDYVGQSMKDETIRKFLIDTVFNEIIPTLDLPESELCQFANSVIDRFENPFIKHSLLSISLNSISKYRTRCLPSLLEYNKRMSKLPVRLTFSLAAIFAFYKGSEIRGGALIGIRNGEEYEIRDDEQVLRFFSEHSRLAANITVNDFLGNVDFWGTDLNRIKGLNEAVNGYLSEINVMGMRKALEKLLNYEIN